MSKSCSFMRPNVDKMTGDQMREEMMRAAHSGATIIGLCRLITDCTACSEAALIMALAAIMTENRSEPAPSFKLIRGLMKNHELMRLVFTEVEMTPIQIQMPPCDPSQMS